MGSFPPLVNSNKEPTSFAFGPDKVPVPNKSPAFKLQPLLAWCVIN